MFGHRQPRVALPLKIAEEIGRPHERSNNGLILTFEI